MSANEGMKVPRGRFLNASLLNNQTATDITGLIFDKDVVVAAKILVHLERRTDTGSEQVQALLDLAVIYDNENGAWSIEPGLGLFDDLGGMGVTFDINGATGQVNYTSTNFAGGSYTGTIRTISIREIKQ